MHYVLGKVIPTQLVALGFLALTILAFRHNQVLLLVIPMVAVFPIVLTFVPRLIIPFFFISFFIGKYLYFVGYIFITLTEALFPVFVLGWFSRYYTRSIDLRDFKVDVPILSALFCFFLSGVVSIAINAHSNTFGYNVVSTVYLVKCFQLLVGFVVLSDRSFPINMEKTINFIFVLSLIQLPVSLAQYLHITSAMSDFNVARTLVRGTLSYHHSMLGTFMFFPMAFALHRLWQSQTEREKRRYLLLLFAFLWVVLLSGSRSALLGLTVVGVIFALSRFKISVGYIAAIVVACLLLVGLYFYSPLGRILATTFSSYGSGKMDSSSMSRLLLWDGAVKHFVTTDSVGKLFGVAMGCFPTVQYDFVIWGGLKTISGAHNNLLHVLVETGILGLVCFITMFVLILVKLHKLGRHNTLARSYFYLTIGMLVTGVTQETFWFQRAFGSMWLFYVVMLALIVSRDEGEKPEKIRAGVMAVGPDGKTH